MGKEIGKYRLDSYCSRNILLFQLTTECMGSSLWVSNAITKFSWSFFLAAACSIGFVLLFLMAIYVQPFLTGKTVDLSQWETEIPTVIYMATALGLVAYISSVSMIWPVYHLFSIPIVFFQIAGLLAFIGLF